MKANKKQPTNGFGNINMLVSSTVIKGDLKTDSDIRFDGTLEGILKTETKLVLGDTANITGEIYCKEADIAGKVKGKIIVSELIILRETAKIEGEITTKKISIEPGAIFDGVCKMIFDEKNTKEEKKEN